MIKISWIQIFATLFQLTTSTYGLCNETNVGVRDELKVIGNNQMTASTDKGTDFLPKFGRLLGTNAWCPNITDEDPYLQIDLGKKYDICAVEVQGEPGALLTTSFTLNSSTDGVTFTEYNSNEQFDGSDTNGDIADFHQLTTSITGAQFIRFKPTSASICLRVEVYGTPEGVAVTCNENNIQVQIDRTVHTALDPNDLRLLDSSCNSSFYNASVINFDITLGTCGTTVVISSDGVKSFYLNEIITNSTGATEFNIICSYIREPTVFTPGQGSFSFDMKIFTDDGFSDELVSNDPIALGTDLYFKVDVQSSDANTELHLTKCLATPSNNVSDPDGYTFIENGCDVESDNDFVSDYNCTKTDNNQTFTLSVFRFASSDAESFIYFHCDVVVCLTSNTGSVCNTECNECNSTSKRKRRAVGDDLAEAHLVRGPYRIIDKDEENSDKVPNDDSHDEDPTGPIEDSDNFPVTLVIVVCVSASVAIAIIIGLLVSIRLAQNARGPAVKDVTVDLARDNLAFEELDIKTLSMKSNEKPI